MSVSDEIIKVLDALAEKFGMVIDWTSQNVVPYVEQLCRKYISYEMVTSVIWMILGIVCCFLGKWFIKLTRSSYAKYNEKPFSNWDCMIVFAGAGTCIAFLIGVSFIIYHIFNIATCLTFPEKIILEELKSLMTTI